MYNENNRHGINNTKSAQAYLDEISTQQPSKKPLVNNKKLLIIAGVLAILAIVIIIVANIVKNNNVSMQDRMTALKAEYEITIGVADYGASNLSHNTLVRTNTEVILLLSSQKQKVSSYASTATEDSSTKFSPNKSSGSSSSKDLSELSILTASFDSAKSSGRFNEVFLSTLSEKLDSLIAELNGILSAKPSNEIKTLATEYITQLQEIKSRL